MDRKGYLDRNKEIQSTILSYIEDDENSDENFQNLEAMINDKNIQNDKHDLSLLFHLVTKIGNNHQRNSCFFDKIDKILSIFLKDIKKYFSNSEIFNIFKSNKRILLFLIEQKIIIFDEYIVKKIISGKYIAKKYPYYFQPEIKPFIEEKWFPKYDKDDKELSDNFWVDEIKKDLPGNFYEKRKVGENDGYICNLIRNDSVEEFVRHITQNNYSLKSTINQSIYETSSFLLKNDKPSLIEYAAFFGSIQIFQNLRLNNVDLTPSLWFYAIHGKNAQIIHLLEEYLDKPNNELYKKYFVESIKCHHNDIANYFQNNYLNNEQENSNDSLIIGLKYYNFFFIIDDLISQPAFYDMCKYDYFILAAFLLDSIDINKIIINLFNKVKNHAFFKIQNHIF